MPDAETIAAKLERKVRVAGQLTPLHALLSESSSEPLLAAKDLQRLEDSIRFYESDLDACNLLGAFTGLIECTALGKTMGKLGKAVEVSSAKERDKQPEIIQAAGQPTELEQAFADLEQALVIEAVEAAQHCLCGSRGETLVDA